MGSQGWPGAVPTHVNELLLLLLRHLAEAVVPACQVSREAVQCLHGHLLHLPPLSTGTGWWQAQPTDAAPRPDPGREHIALVKLAKLNLQQTGAVGCWWGGVCAEHRPVHQGSGRAPCSRPGLCGTAARLAHLGGIQVRDMLHGAWVVPVVSLLDHRVKQLGKHLEGHGTACSSSDPESHRAPATSTGAAWGLHMAAQGTTEGGWGHLTSCSTNGNPQGRHCPDK